MSSEHISDRLLHMATIAAAKATTGSMRKKLEESPALSIATVLGSLMTLGKRLKKLGSLELGLAEFASWDRPALTISWLILWTVICFRPYLVACGPLLYLLTGFFIPNYAKKYALIIAEDPVVSEFDSAAVDPILETKIEEEVEETRDLFEALRKAQASLAKLVATLDKFDDFRDRIAGFEDPQKSCMVFLVLLGALFGTYFAASLVNPPLLFASGAWLAVGASHPAIKRLQKYLSKIELELFADAHAVEDLIAWLGEHEQDFSITDAPLEREVEVFELQQQGLTPRLYDTVIQSPYLYSESSRYRADHRLPPGTRNLGDILPPDGWSFVDFTDLDDWIPDKDASAWIKDRELTKLRGEGEWAYDESGEYRRRRWTRKCYRCF